MSKKYEIKETNWRGKFRRILKCPKCGEWLEIDEDQYHGQVSTWHDVPNCGFHETIDFSKTKDERSE